MASALIETRHRAPDADAGPSGSSPPPPAHEVQAALERILASRSFSQAARASNLLRFVVEQTLAGHGDRLKGYVLATTVFGRPADFDAQADPLVRVEAGRLRRRLAGYYATEGRSDAIRISLPRGRYTPEWRYASHALRPRAPHAAAPTAGERRWRRVSSLLAAALVVTIASLVWLLTPLGSNRSAAPAAGPVGVDSRDRVPVIVAPFDNLSGEDELDRWATAMTEEILVRLAQLDVLVIAHTRTGPDEHTPRPAADAAYVLTGSIRTAGDSARITVRLSEAATGAMLWSAAYTTPRNADGLPALNERMALAIATAAAPFGPIYEAELERARRAANPTPGLRDCFAAYYEYRRRPSPPSHNETRSCFESVTARRPGLANAWAGLALLRVDALANYSGSLPLVRHALRAQAREAIDKAKGIEANNARAALAEARLLYFVDAHAFPAAAERALTLDPNGAETLAVIGTLLALSENSERGLALVDRAAELTPNPPGLYELARAAVHLRHGNAEEALDAALQIGAPNWYAMPLFITAAAGLAGRRDVAERAGRQLREIEPELETTIHERLRTWRIEPALSSALLRGLVAAEVLPPSSAPPDGV